MKDTTKKNKRDFNKHFNKINNGDFFLFFLEETCIYSLKFIKMINSQIYIYIYIYLYNKLSLTLILVN